VNDGVDRSRARSPGEERFDLLRVVDLALGDRIGLELGGRRLQQLQHAALEAHLVGDGDVRAGTFQPLSDAPSKAVFICYPEDDGTLSGERKHCSFFSIGNEETRRTCQSSANGKS
jgi:hypothetical protein